MYQLETILKYCDLNVLTDGAFFKSCGKVAKVSTCVFHFFARVCFVYEGTYLT